MGKIRDWFGNDKAKAQKAGPHTGTGDSGSMGKQPRVTFRDASGKVIKAPKKK
jgi:hypothetical protein